MPGAPILNLYGSSEVAGDVTYYLCNSGKDLSGSVPIGRPISNTQIYLLDQYAQPVPLGAIGEIYIGGDNLASRYLNLPELSRERFILNPLGNAPSGRLFRTGDLARYTSNNNLEYMGRIDDQVKIRGFRIELGEIESQLNRHPKIKTAIVLAREDVVDEKRLVAYLTLFALPEASEREFLNELKTYLQRSIPEYMIPTAFLILDALPLNSNGKVDRKALPVPNVRCMQDDYIAASTETEQDLVEIWASLLHLEWGAISVDASFFSLGGHSLLVIRFISEVKNKFDVELQIRKVFELGTIVRIASFIDGLIEHDMIVRKFQLLETSGLNEVEI